MSDNKVYVHKGTTFAMAGGLLACVVGMMCLHSQIGELRQELQAQSDKNMDAMVSAVKLAMAEDPKMVFQMARRGGELAKIDSMTAMWKKEAKLEKPAMEIGTGILSRGNGQVVDVFTNFDCPYCRAAHGGLEKVDGVKFSVHLVPNSEPADLASRVFIVLAGKDAEKAWAFYDELMGMRDASVWRTPVKGAEGAGQKYPVLQGLAAKHGLDAESFAGLLDNKELEKRLRADTELAQKAGMRGTPFYVIGGKVRVQGSVPGHLFKDALSIASGAADKTADKDAGKESGKVPAKESAKEPAKAHAGESLLDGSCESGEPCGK